MGDGVRLEEGLGGRLEVGVGVGEGNLEGVGVREERVDVVGGADEVLIVGLADILYL